MATITEKTGAAANPIESVYPLSPLQHGLLFHSRRDAGSGVYVVQTAYELLGSVDESCFKKAWEEVIQRHAILRTAFLLDQEPRQAVFKRVPLPWLAEDWSALSSFAAQQRLDEFLSADRQRGFDFRVAPLLRLALFRIDKDKYWFIWSNHHALLDGWSGALVIKEVLARYQSLLRRVSLRLPPPTPYKDYVRWRERQDQNKGKAYWRRVLSGIEAPTPLPFPPAESGSGVDELGLTWDEQKTASFKKLVAQERLTLNSVILGMWAVLLGRLSGDSVVLFGNINSSRPAAVPGIETTVGLFISNLPVRISIDHERSRVDWLREVQRQQAEARQHDYVSLTEIHGCSDIPRGVPMFETLVVFENYATNAFESAHQRDASPAEAPSFQGRLLSAREQGSFPISLVVAPADRLGFKLSFHQDTLSRDNAQQILSSFDTLLSSFLNQPYQAVGDLALLSPREAESIINLGAGPVLHSRNQTIASRFSEQVRATPDAVALVFGDHQVSYRALDLRTNQLANYLRSLGIGPETRVALSVNRGIEMIEAVLGIVKTGAAYLPIDPHYPEARKDLILEDCCAALLIDGAWLENLRTVIDSQPASAVSSQALPANLAYIIYTSGSTGKPKGVEVQQSNVVAHVEAQIDAFVLGPGAAVLQFASLSFDAAVWEWALALLTGASLILAPRDQLMPGEGLESVIERHQVSLTSLSPSVLAVIDTRVLSTLRNLVASAEACPKELADLLSSRVRLVNEYGPTESTVCVTISDPFSLETVGVPIGRPLPNTRLYIVDSQGALLPRGAIGELWIGGEVLARDYLQRPALTAERFTPDPFSNKPGGRIYRTGDRARWRNDGQLEFLGRSDDQVKIRGFRVELNEISAAILKVPEVRQCAVVLHQDSIVAYVAGSSIDLGRLREELVVTLPSFMVPAALIELPSLPLNANGKLDRKALPPPETGEVVVALDRPLTVTEELVTGIWCQVLKLQSLSRNAGFFESGGHSLLAAQVVSRVREVFKIEIPLRSLLAGATVTSIADIIDNARQTKLIPPVTIASRTAELPLSFSQQRLWFLEQLEPGLARYHVPAALRLRGRLDESALRRSLNEVVRRHEILRTRFEIGLDSRPIQIIDPPSECPLSFLDISGEQNPEVALGELKRAEVGRGFHLERGPLLRTTLVKTAAEEHVILLLQHHIISDGWSIGVWIRELSTLYDAFSRNALSPLADLQIQYADYSVWQRNSLSVEVLEPQLEFWRQRLAGAESLRLPTDFALPGVPTRRSAQISFEISKDTAAALRSLSNREGATLFMTLLAAWQFTLGRHCGQDDVSVGTPVANRNRAEVEPLIGFFVNTLVLRSRWQHDPTFIEFLRSVRDQVIADFENQDVPFERLVDELSPNRDLNRTPLFQSMLVLQNMPAVQLRLGDIEVTPEDISLDSAKFELTLSVNELPTGAIAGMLEYAAELWKPESIECLAARWQKLLREIVQKPDRPLSELSLIDDAGRAEIIAASTGPRDPYPPITIGEALTRQATLTPEAVALVFENRELTYAEFEHRTNRLAHYLIKLGVRAETRCAVCLDRGIDAVVALFAIIKAGGAYVPLDPQYPAQRLQFMLQDSRASALITQQNAPSLETTTIIKLDALEPSLACESIDPPNPGISNQNLAYVIYTSGSSGQPKGVEVQHQSVVNLAHTQGESFQLGPGKAILQFASLSFDAAVWDWALALLSGAKLVLGRKEVLLPGVGLEETINNQRVTLVSLPPSVLAAISAEDDLNSLDTLVVAAEACPASLAKRWGAKVTMRNEYGPTEATVCVTMSDHLGGETDPVPIGRPLANSRLYVLDSDGALALPGAAGELYIGGDVLARGYSNRPSLTAERFVPDSFSGQPGARLYRTGDKVRRRSDGQLEYLGRIDEQIKLRGFRIELGEIEAALSAEPGIQQCAVVLRETTPANPQLVAFVVGEGVSPVKLRENLAAKLPEYMVPSSIFELPSLPLTPNGKLDRKSLSTLSIDHPLQKVSPRNLAEWHVQKIWSETLNISDIGIHDNFFELGGHSLTVAVLAARLSKEFSRRVPVRDVFANPTIAQLSDYLRQSTSDSRPSSGLLPIQTKGSHPPLFCLHPTGVGAGFNHLSRYLGSDQPVYAIQSRLLIDSEFESPSNFEEMARQYIEEIRSVQPSGPYQLVGYSSGGVLAFEIARELHSAGETISLLAILDGGLTKSARDETLRSTEDAVLNQRIQDTGLSPEHFAALSFESRVALYLERGKQKGELPVDIETSQIIRSLRSFAINYRAARCYRAQPLAIPITLVHTSLRQDPQFLTDWREVAAVGLETFALPETHEKFIDEPNIQAIAKIIKEKIDHGNI